METGVGDTKVFFARVICGEKAQVELS